MRRLTAYELLYAIVAGASSLALSQPAPPAVIADPPADSAFPPAMVPLTVPGHRVDKDAVFYLAGGAGPHGTVLLLHGLPGYEQNADLAQSIRRAGWNVLIFHYRGSWGTAGTFSQSAAIEDTADALRFLRDAATKAKYRIDPGRIVVIGHSFGGFLAGYSGAHDADVEAVGMIAAVNLGKMNHDPKQREARLKRWESEMHPLHGTSAPALFAEAEKHGKEWDYVQWADSLRGRPVLLVEANDQNRADMQLLAVAMREKSTVSLTEKSVATDHSFSDHRIALQAIVVDWLQTITLAKGEVRTHQ
jgi:pimeloyl-ACP methyl ester carboxylesterase